MANTNITGKLRSKGGRTTAPREKVARDSFSKAKSLIENEQKNQALSYNQWLLENRPMYAREDSETKRKMRKANLIDYNLYLMRVDKMTNLTL